uniref:uncharacterized protein LOC122589977 n=1 Tax=Erigeron canadensis TaxID=72917 RepID=UPI001CB964CC|nr:uncharacterized protein LOC122589977 [Erigeron canadensis]
MGNMHTVYAPLAIPFKPTSEWRKEEDYDTLLVYLPSFYMTEATTNEDLNIVKVRGEGWHDGNVRVVNEDYRVPENCEMRGICYSGGILKITMSRRKMVDTPQIPPKTDEQAFKATKQEEPLVDNALTLQQMPMTSSYSPIKQEPLKTSTLEEKEVYGESAFGSNVPKKDTHNVAEKPWLDAGEGMHALLENMSKNNFKDGGLILGQRNDGRDGFQGDKILEENYEKVLTNEDRKLLLVNVGVGVLVIVALGVHLSYTTGFIGKGK